LLIQRKTWCKESQNRVPPPSVGKTGTPSGSQFPERKEVTTEKNEGKSGSDANGGKRHKNSFRGLKVGGKIKKRRDLFEGGEEKRDEDPGGNIKNCGII